MNLLTTPCFIFDKAEFLRGIAGFQKSLQAYFGRSIIGYSVKTNSLPYCLKEAYSLGCYAEVVSHDEYQLAILCGYTPDRIIYNGPMKSRETFLEAIRGNAFVNIETKRELKWLEDLPKDSCYSIGIRLNINISDISPANADGDNDNSRFGFSDKTSDFSEAIKIINNYPHIKLSGLHIHRTTHSRSVEFYRDSIDYAATVINKYGLKLSYIDVGGGYYGIFKDKPTFFDYTSAFFDVLKRHNLENLIVIVEPGNALIASSFSFLSKVIDVKNNEPNHLFITTDGSRNDIDPFFKKTKYMSEILYNDEARDMIQKQEVTGCTCLENDRLFSIENAKEMKIGDRIYYKNVGAYTMCFSPMFIRYWPTIYLKDKNGYKVIRENWTANEYNLKSINNE